MKTASKRTGSALIMTIVLTVLLAIVGTLFLLMARTEKMATSGRSDSEELKLAAESIVGVISQTLSADEPNVSRGIDYYDYPGRWNSDGSPSLQDWNDSWLANLEPYEFAPNDYRWRHISDVYSSYPASYLGVNAYNVGAIIIEDYQKAINANVTADANNQTLGDADGDGVADSRWVAVPNLTTSKGKPVFAAVRIIDNGGMLNINTGYKFEPTLTATAAIPETRIDGSSPMDVNAVACSGRDGTHDPLAERCARLFYERFNTTGITPGATTEPPPLDYDNYSNDVVWRVQPTGTYTLFDVSDELKLRNRYILNYIDITTRIEKLWTDAYDIGLRTPVGSLAGDKWFPRAYNTSPIDSDLYDYRHISTAYNMDRVIDVNGHRMAWLNDPAMDANAFYTNVLVPYVTRNIPAAYQGRYLDEFAQAAADINDYRDNDSDVTTLTANGKTYYGVEKPFIYIAELARNFVTFPGPPPVIHRSYGIVICKQPGSETFSGWQLIVPGQGPINLTNASFSAGGFYVHMFRDFVAPLTVDPIVTPIAIDVPPDTQILIEGFSIQLTRPVGADRVVVDEVPVPRWFVEGVDGELRYKRDMAPERWVKRLWDIDGAQQANLTLLGGPNGYDGGSANPIQVWVANGPFKNVGDIGYMLTKAVYHKPGDDMTKVIGYQVGSNTTTDTEDKVRLNLADPNVQRLFQYIAVFNPGDTLQHPGNAAGETRIKGRININTAPWFVIKQLPWVGRRNDYDANSLAQAIAAYRDKLDLTSTGGPDYKHNLFPGTISATDSRRQETGIIVNEIPGFRSIGELTAVINNSNKDNYSMRYYAIGGNGTKTGNDIHYPDLTTADTGSNDLAAGDFEKRNLIFARISDLVTVRSDVFTAYILVRLGADGPQRRVMAILDRSESPTKPVKIIALQPVPDAR